MKKENSCCIFFYFAIQPNRFCACLDIFPFFSLFPFALCETVKNWENSWILAKLNYLIVGARLTDRFARIKSENFLAPLRQSLSDFRSNGLGILVCEHRLRPGAVSATCNDSNIVRDVLPTSTTTATTAAAAVCHDEPVRSAGTWTDSSDVDSCCSAKAICVRESLSKCLSHPDLSLTFLSKWNDW